MSDAPASWGANGPVPHEINWTTLDRIPKKEIRWVDYPFLQASAFHLLAGIKNAGKGTYLAHLAAMVTRGELPVGRRVIWLALGEDSYALDVHPRVEVAGGDPRLVTVPTSESEIMLPVHLEEIEQMMGTPGDVGLVVVDPIGGALASGLSTNRDSDVRPMLRALNHLADEYGTMVVGVRHISIKTDARKNGALSGIMGSSDWVNVPRAVLALFHDDAESSTRHLFVLTGNRSPEFMPGRIYQIESVAPVGFKNPVSRMSLLGESLKDPDELLSTKRDRRDSRSADAEAMIIDILGERGQMESSVLDAVIAEQSGLSARTVQRIRVERLGRNGRGLIRAVPEKLPGSEKVSKWWVDLTEAGRLDHMTRYTDSPTRESGVPGASGASGPDTPDTTTHTHTHPHTPDTSLSLPLEDDDGGTP